MADIWVKAVNMLCLTNILMKAKGQIKLKFILH